MTNLLALLQKTTEKSEQLSHEAEEILSAAPPIKNVCIKPPIKFKQTFFTPAKKEFKKDILPELASALQNLQLKQIAKTLPSIGAKNTVFNFAHRHEFTEQLIRGVTNMRWLTPTLIQDRIYSIPTEFNSELKQAAAFANLSSWCMELHPIWKDAIAFARYERTMREHFLHEVAHFCSHLGAENGHGNKWRTCMWNFNYIPRICSAGAFFNQRDYTNWPEKHFLMALETYKNEDEENGPEHNASETRNFGAISAEL